MRLFFAGPAGMLVFWIFEVSFLAIAWGGKMGNDALIVVALIANILFAFITFLNPMVILGLAGVAAGAATVPGGQTPGQAASGAVDIYLRVTQGASHAATLLIISLFILDYAFNSWVFCGTGALLLAWGQYALAFPGPSPWPRRVALGILLAVTLGAIAVSLSPSVANFLTGRPFWSGVEYKEAAIAERNMGKNDADINGEAIQRVNAAILKYRIRNDAGLDRHVGGAFSANDLAIFRAIRDGRWNTLPKIATNGAAAIAGATPGIVSSPWFVPWAVGVLAVILVIVAIRRGRGVWVAGILLTILVAESLLWEKTRNEFWYGVIQPGVTGEIPVDYTTTEITTTVVVPAGKWKVSRAEPEPGRDVYTMECYGQGHVVGQGQSLSGTVRVNGVPMGGHFTSTGTATVTLAAPSSCTKVTGPVSATLHLVREY